MREQHALTRASRGARIVAVVGATASGKSAVALELALALDGEVVSVDSMQVYRGMDLGTAKANAADQARLRHHLIDLVDVGQGFDAAAFRDAALPLIESLLARGKTPVLCGGTGLYFVALRHGLGVAPGSSSELRRTLEEASLDELLDELHRRDPLLYSSIDRRNRRRVVRAVEVVRLTASPFSAQRSSWPRPDLDQTGEIEDGWQSFGLLRAPDELAARIDARVEQMLEHGLIAETRRLLDLGLAENRTAMQAIGYRQVVEHLRGERSLAETKELIKRKTRQLAKRQMTWFRRQMRVTWLNVRADETNAEIAGRIAQLVRPR